jgi:hypothetical protein
MNKEKKYCASPWRSLHLNFEGQIKTCCAGSPNMLGKLSDGSIESILQSPKLKEIKESIQKGVLHEEYCENCIRREDAGGRSERDWHNNLNEDFNITTANLDEHIPSLIDVRWNNTCNLACTYCTPYFSTKWASIVGESQNQTINSEYQQVVDYIDKHKTYVKEVAMVGGEPLMMKENHALLNILTDDVLVTIISNMTVDFDKFPVPQQLLKRERVGWSMSFDNIGKRFEYVRWGSTWEQLNKNVITVSDKINNSNHHGGIHSVYNIYNCTRLCELKQYAVDRNITILWQHIYGDHLDPTQHNKKIRQLAINEIQKYRDTFEISDSDAIFLDSTEKNLQQGTTDKSKEFLEFTEKLENQWHPDQKGQFAKLWPEIAKAL